MTSTRLSMNLAFLLLLVPAATVLAQATSDPRFGRTPLFFEENGGHYPESASYVSRGPGWQAFLGARSSTLAIHPRGERPGVAIRTTFEGANPEAAMRAAQPLATRVHHLIGNDPTKWSTGNRTFRRVVAEELWPGIDLVWYGEEGGLRYDFVVAPGADPGAIRMRIEGADVLRIRVTGELIIDTPAGELVQSVPVLYQGDGEEVAGRFVLLGENRVGFAVDAWDRSRALVIDPLLTWACLLGGTGADDAQDIAVDPAGNVVISGKSSSTNLPTSPGVIQPNRNGNTDAFVAKISATGDTLLWCTYLGGSFSAGGFNTPVTEAHGIGTDAAGNVIVGGFTNGGDFPTTPGSHQPAVNGGADQVDAFLSVVVPTGDAFVWSTYFGAAGTLATDRIHTLAVAGSGDITVAGMTSFAFPATAGAWQTSDAPSSDGFVARFTAAGGLVWATYLGGSGTEEIADLAVDGLGRAYVVGLTNATDLPLPGGFQTSYGGGFRDAFLARLSADGSNLDYATLLGGSGDEGIWVWPGIAALDDGRVWTTLSTDSSNFPTTPGATFPNQSAGPDAAVACLDTNLAGSASLLWSTYLGSSGTDIGRSVVVDPGGTCIATGWTEGSNFPLLNALQPCAQGRDYWFASFDSLGLLLWSTRFGAPSQDPNTSDKLVGGLSRDLQGNLFLAGTAYSTAITTPGALVTPNAVGSTSPMVAKFSPGAVPLSGTVVRSPCATGGVPMSLQPLNVPAPGANFQVAIDDPTAVAGVTPGSTLTFWFISAAPIAQYPCGTPIPGAGPNGALGEVMIDVFTQPGWFFTPAVIWQGPGTPAIHSLPIPCSPLFNGLTVYTQGAFWDPVAGFTIVTEALEVTIGL